MLLLLSLTVISENVCWIVKLKVISVPLCVFSSCLSAQLARYLLSRYLYPHYIHGLGVVNQRAVKWHFNFVLFTIFCLLLFNYLWLVGWQIELLWLAFPSFFGFCLFLLLLFFLNSTTCFSLICGPLSLVSIWLLRSLWSLWSLRKKVQRSQESGFRIARFPYDRYDRCDH